MPCVEHIFVETVDREEGLPFDQLKVPWSVKKNRIRAINYLVQPRHLSEPSHLIYCALRIGPIERFPKAFGNLKTCRVIKAGGQLAREGRQIASPTQHRNDIGIG